MLCRQGGAGEAQKNAISISDFCHLPLAVSKHGVYNYKIAVFVRQK
jgi:hypothetical protein